MRHKKRDSNLSMGSELCLLCGLCCTGALHYFVGLDDDENELVTQLGLNLYSGDKGEKGLTQPCPYYRGNKCSIYIKRPKVCKKYNCNLLERYQQGKIDPEESKAIIKETKDLIDVLYQYIGAYDLLQRPWEIFHDFLEKQRNNMESEEFIRVNARFFFDIGRLKTIINEHFERQKDDKEKSNHDIR
jgi:Fe-S-cluster containining protein